LTLPADLAGIFGRLKAAVFDDFVHAEIDKPTGMEERAAISFAGKNFCDWNRGDIRVDFRAGVKRGESRPEQRYESFDALGVDGVSVLENDGGFAQLRQGRHWIERSAV
jgi:hypothetical protein